MKKFRFKLEALLRYRAFLERRTQLEMAEIRSDLSACRQLMQAVRRVMGQTQNQLGRELVSGIPTEQYQHFICYMDGLQSRHDQEQERHRRLASRLAQKQQMLTRQAIQKKSLQQLKARQQTQYYQAAALRQLKTTDDLVMARKTRERNR